MIYKIRKTKNGGNWWVIADGDKVLFGGFQSKQEAMFFIRKYSKHREAAAIENRFEVEKLVLL